MFVTLKGSFCGFTQEGRFFSVGSLTPVAGFSRENTLEPFLTVCTSHINRAHLSHRPYPINYQRGGWLLNSVLPLNY
jgi:hypothetical protein